MLYELQVLRNGTPVADKASAIELLDNFDNHLVGQPCAIRYYADEEQDEIRLLFAVGKRSYIADKDVYDTNRSENYQIINDGDDTTLYWQTIADTLDSIISTGNKVSLVTADIDKFNAANEKGLIDNDIVSFVTNSSTNQIYLGDKVFGTTSLNDLKVQSEIVVNDGEATEIVLDEGDTLEKVLEKLTVALSNITIKWNDDFNLNFITCSQSDYAANVKADMEDNERNFYEVTRQENTPNAYHVGNQLVGDAWETSITDLSKRTVLNYGEFHYDNGIEDYQKLSNMSVGKVIDLLLFPEHPLVNYAIVNKKQIDVLFDKYWQYDPSENPIPGGGDEPYSGHIAISNDQIDDIMEKLDNGIAYTDGTVAPSNTVISTNKSEDE